MRPSLFLLVVLCMWGYSQAATTTPRVSIDPKDGSVSIDPKLTELKDDRVPEMNQRQDNPTAKPRRKPYPVGAGDKYTMVPKATGGRTMQKYKFKAEDDCDRITVTCDTNSFSSPNSCKKSMRFIFKDSEGNTKVKPECGTDVGGISFSTDEDVLDISFVSKNRKNKFSYSCCVSCDTPTSATTTSTTTAAATTTTTPSPTRDYNPFANSGCSGSGSSPVCGDPSVMSRVVGGMDTTIETYPWQCALTSSRFSTSPFCGCSIVNDKFIITAAHCVDGDSPGDFLVAVGSTDITSATTRVGVSSITVHPQYNSNTFLNDIAVVELSSPLTFSDSVMPVCAPDTSDDYAGETAKASGWGTLSSGGSQPQILQAVDLPIISNAACETAYSRYGIRIPSAMICATAAGKDTCQGDSGGPLAVANDDSVYSLVGVVSWGIGCATNPGVYARVTEFMTFINGLVDDGEIMCV